LGFSKVEAEATGRPPYAPGDLLKLYVYGYLNQVRSSRRLEREARHNLEVLWLIKPGGAVYLLSNPEERHASYRRDQQPHAPRLAAVNY